MMTKEECEAVHAPTFALYEEANVNLTKKLTTALDTLDDCQGKETTLLA